MTAMNDYCKGNGFSLFYSINGQGESIVFVHGNFTDSRIWDNQVEDFSEKYHIITYDLRGYGKSSKPESTFSHTEDLKYMIDSLNINKVTLVGSSLGGSIAIDFTLEYPNLVNKLILIAPALSGYKYPFRLSMEAFKNIYQLKAKGSKVAIDKFIKNLYWEYLFPSPKSQEARERVLNIIREEKNFYSYNPNLSKSLNPNAVNRLNIIEKPTLIVLSNRDRDFNINVGNYIQKNIEGSEKIVMSDCCHLPFVERPQEFNRLVLDFL